MKRAITFSLAAAGVLALSLGTATAAGVYDGSSTVIGIDTSLVPDSNEHGSEVVAGAVDQNAATKYLNFGGQGTGLIVTPSTTDTIVQSLIFTAANDAPGRDPFSFELWGTDDAITSGSNSLGDDETWTLIDTGVSGLDPDPGRQMPGTPVDITNGADFDSYRIFFTDLRDNNTIMQIADIQFYTGLGGTGTGLLNSGDAAVSVTNVSATWPGGEAPADALDMDTGTKYLHFGEEGAGMIVTNGSPTIVDSLTFSTANDAPERDPLTWSLYGTDDAITSGVGSAGDEESWTLVDTGATGFDSDPGREQVGATQAVANTTAYGAYRLVFDTIRDSGAANSMQISGIEFGGTVIPEPTSLVLAMFGLAACGLGRRRA